MILAGTLKYRLVFKKIENTQTDTGFIEKNKVVLFYQKAQKLNYKNKYGVDSKELFNLSILEFKLRYNKLINIDLIVEFENKEYKIISVDDNKFDNSMIIIIEKIND